MQLSTQNPLQAYMLKVTVVVDTEDMVEEAEEDAVAEVDEEEKGRKPETAHIAEWTTAPPKTAGSIKGSNPDGSSNHSHSHANVHETSAAMIMMSSAIIVKKPQRQWQWKRKRTASH